MARWHGMEAGAVLDELKSRREGLDGAERKRRLEKWGPNELEEPEGKGLLARFFGQMADPMIFVLLCAAFLSLVASGWEDWVDPVIILVIVIGNSVISIVQENGAKKALEALKDMSAPVAKIKREGAQVRVPARELVPGDVVELESGDMVPADGRILSCAGLQTDESAMTGESLPVDKGVEAVDPDAPLGDRRSMVLSGTTVTAGRGTFVVTSTGMDTEVGRIAGLLGQAEEVTTPLQRKMEEISKGLSFACLAVCAVMFGVGLLQHRGMADMFLTAVSLAVAAIPEGLPAIVSIVLAMGVRRLAGRKAIVKTMPAVETLGCASVICSDKTGTLTRNEMTVVELWTAAGVTEETLLAMGALCCDAGSLEGDPTEQAIVRAAAKRGLDKETLEGDSPRVGERPFDSDRKLMATIHKRGDGWRVIVKGAPDVLLGRCGAVNYAAAGRNEDMAGRALRVLGVAWKDTPRRPNPGDADLEWGLTFGGLIGMMDPPRAEAKGAVAACYRAGIKPVMITGDHRLTAVAVARELGICRPGDMALTGEELDFMPQEVLEDVVERCTVYARVSPEHKMRIVRAWQKKGRVVAMTGDGVNDAPALKGADIGCAMGKAGTDVAKGAADMILTDDDFATIVAAVAEGRGVYANIKKAIHYLLSCNIGEMVTIFFATVLGFGQMPLLPVQLLWLNLVTDSLPALALGVEPVEEGVMERPPRGQGENLFDRAFTLRLCWQGVMVGGLTLAAYWLGHNVLGGSDQAANTMAFATLTMCQLFHAYNARGEDRSVFALGLLSNKAMNRAFLAGMVMQLAVLLLPPLQGVFSVVSMTGAQWGAVMGLAVAPVVICEGVKRLGRRK